VDRLRRRAVRDEFAHELREAPRSRDHRLELLGREPARLVDALRDQLVCRERRARVEVPDTHEVVALALARPAPRVDEPVHARPDLRPELVVAQADLLGELALERVLVALALLDAAARRRPPRAERVLEANGERPPLVVEDERAHAAADGQAARPAGELLEPAQALVPRDRGVRRRGRRQDEEPGLAEPPLLQAERRTLVEEAAAQVARAGRRPVGGVRDADALLQQLELLARLVEARREPRGLQQAPEVVARVREVRRGGGRDASGVDAAEDDPEPWAEHVGDGAPAGYAASCSGWRASSRASRLRRRSSPVTSRSKRGRRGSAFETMTVRSQPR